MNITQWLSEIDHELFVFVNSKAAGPAVDWLFILLRNALTWIPLYAFVLFWIVTRHKKYAWQFVLISLIVFAITDFTSASILKPMFLRLRPCADPTLEGNIRVLVNCGGKYGMPSSHASNHFGLASFWFFSISAMSNRKWYWLWLWALLIVWAQVYVGKHFPGDVAVGALLGTLVGTLMAALFSRWLIKRPIARNKLGE